MSYKYKLTNKLVLDLMAIESAREAVKLTVLPPVEAETIRRRARVRSTHYSTRIEGNRLTLKETKDVLEQGRIFRGRERDVREVRNYFNALQMVEEWAETGVGITEERIRKLHAVIHRGSRARATSYRKEQNVIRDSATGAIVYLPPEAKDVPILMKSLGEWILKAERDRVPVPIIAGMAHYHFVTIHPFYDGNGRTARAAATWILYKNGYDLGKFYSLEEFYANDLDGYYSALQTHPHHNYYEGRDKADATPWLEFFIGSMSEVFRRTAEEVLKQSNSKSKNKDLSPLKNLDRRARIVLGLFGEYPAITTRQAAGALGLSERQCRDLMKRWVKDGWLLISNRSNKCRSYILSAVYRRFIGG